MLSAEHTSLQHRLVQQLVSIREKEMNYMLSRYQTVGTQTALLGGFTVSTLSVGLNPAYYRAQQIAQSLFVVTTIIVACAAVNVILCTVLIANWAPGLALRGPTGSVARAYHAVRAERTQIMVHFFVVVVGFVWQTIMAIWYFLLPNQPDLNKVTGASGQERNQGAHDLVPTAILCSCIGGAMLTSAFLSADAPRTTPPSMTE